MRLCTQKRAPENTFPDPLCTPGCSTDSGPPGMSVTRPCTNLFPEIVGRSDLLGQLLAVVAVDTARFCRIQIGM
jgi:hypothetical protein